MTYSAWVSTLRADCLQRQKLASRRAASASSSSAWPTPKVSDMKGADPARSENRSGDRHQGAHDAMTPKTPEQIEAMRERAAPRKGGGPPGITNLNEQAPTVWSLWSTPSVADVEGGRTSRSGDRSSEIMLNGQAKGLTAALWSTVTALSFDGSHQPGNSRSMNATMDMARSLAEGVSSHQDPTTSRDGSNTSTGALRLNPLFVELLMGWPEGLAHFACSATAASLWRSRMAFALSQIASPPAVPQQLDLFGG
jgi:hypothetical protein